MLFSSSLFNQWVQRKVPMNSRGRNWCAVTVILSDNITSCDRDFRGTSRSCLGGGSVQVVLSPILPHQTWGIFPTPFAVPLSHFAETQRSTQIWVPYFISGDGRVHFMFTIQYRLVSQPNNSFSPPCSDTKIWTIFRNKQKNHTTTTKPQEIKRLQNFKILQFINAY